MPLRFHWRLPHGGETSGATRAAQAARTAIALPDLEAQVNFCRRAEACGIDSVLTDFGFAKPDPILLAAALGAATERIKFIVAYRSGLVCPAAFVQQVNTLSALTGGRVSLNVVAGYSPREQRSYGDFLPHDERYERTDEFLHVCRAFWAGGEVDFAGKYYRVEGGRLHTPFVSPERDFPEILVAGSSLAARRLAVRRGTCWMRLADAPERIREETPCVTGRGLNVGLRLSVIVRETRAEAVGAAHSLVERAGGASGEDEFVRTTDSVSFRAAYELAGTEWITPVLWAGAVRAYGPPALALVGTPAEVAEALMEYASAGVSQFILSGWPKLDEMQRFAAEVLPLVRRMERAAGPRYE